MDSTSWIYLKDLTPTTGGDDMFGCRTKGITSSGPKIPLVQGLQVVKIIERCETQNPRHIRWGTTMFSMEQHQEAGIPWLGGEVIEPLSIQWCSYATCLVAGFIYIYIFIFFTLYIFICSSYVHPYFGKWSNLTMFFQIGWNYQLDLDSSKDALSTY